MKGTGSLKTIAIVNICLGIVAIICGAIGIYSITAVGTEMTTKINTLLVAIGQDETVVSLFMPFGGFYIVSVVAGLFQVLGGFMLNKIAGTLTKMASSTK